jgi:type I restriction enzyme S subunit
VGSATGSTVKHTSPERILSYEFKLPAYAEQQAIASILGSLDDKIELNRRMNETLEAMAQAIFKDWFVDFGPVRRKQAGVEDPSAILGGLIPNPARAAKLAALFPVRLGDDGLPMGWEEKPLDQIADFLNGLALQKFPPKHGAESLPVIKIAQLRSGISASADRAACDIPAKYIIKDGDFLFSWSGSLLAKFWTSGEGALNQHLFKVTSEIYPKWFFAFWTLFHLVEFQLIAETKATTMGHIQRHHLSAAMTICPNLKSIDQMSSVFDHLISLKIQNELQNRTLAETRDYLLPKLMSGEVRVSDAEALIKEAAE